ncbi:putative RNA-binding protein associated with RNAse of E/G family [Peribacillus huizhouensis]|uniref:RNA-binding protein associated with RNAse of E/G family n=1 Tax=Peribacillus huizhouensis TaxID=1501239 RepID=A0ABR6CTJ3_9BACI|nr:putative RNA-binding protein associated with RNAse of E/G family [Peribacillus huizhouensis]
MVNLSFPTIQSGDKIIERKIRYDSVVVEYSCKLLKVQNQNVVLFHIIQESFTMIANQTTLIIPKGSYTIAYYWKDRPYNLYIWRDNKGKYLGSYFNIVKNTYLTDKLVSFEDLIIDIMVLPNGDYFILDEDELPEPLDQFENGSVLQALNSLTDSIDILLSQIISETENTYKHEEVLPWLNNR